MKGFGQKKGKRKGYNYITISKHYLGSCVYLCVSMCTYGHTSDGVHIHQKKASDSWG